MQILPNYITWLIRVPNYRLLGGCRSRESDKPHTKQFIEKLTTRPPYPKKATSALKVLIDHLNLATFIFILLNSVL